MRDWPAWILACAAAATAAACGLDQSGLAEIGIDGGAFTTDGSVVGDAPNSGADGSGDGAGKDAGGDGAVVDAMRDADAAADVGPGVDATPDTGGRDASPDSGPDPGIRCGGGFCSSPAQYCCKTGGLYTCLLSGIACVGTSIRCDDAAECAGNQVCCARVDGNNQLQGVDCTGAGACQQNDVVLCDPGAANLCGGSMTCQATTTGIQGYSECR